MTERFRQILVIAATLAMLVFNWMSATGALGGIAANVVSDNNPTRITPAGYAFAIWTAIYGAMIAFSIYQALPRNLERLRPFRTLYILSCALNCVWLWFWQNESLIACLVTIVLLLATLLAINWKLRTTDTVADYWILKASFGLYAGWVTAATLVNAMIVLAAARVSAADSLWLPSVFIFAAAACAIAVRIVFSNHIYPLAIAWALTAIAVKQSGATIIVVFCAIGVIASLIAAVSFVMEKESRQI